MCLNALVIRPYGVEFRVSMKICKRIITKPYAMLKRLRPCVSTLPSLHTKVRVSNDCIHCDARLTPVLVAAVRCQRFRPSPILTKSQGASNKKQCASRCHRLALRLGGHY